MGSIMYNCSTMYKQHDPKENSTLSNVDLHTEFAHVARRIEDHCSKIERLITHLQRQIPVYVDERLYMQNSTLLTLQPQSQNLELITFIFAVVTASGGATLTLGNRTILLPTGNTTLQCGQGSESGWILNNGDVRQISQNVAGLLGLELSGIEIPDKGVF